MPRVARFLDVQFLSPQEFADATRFSNHGPIQTKTHGGQVRLQRNDDMATTRQGVRNLDTPRNGRRATHCVHVRDPQGTPTVIKPHLLLDKDTGAPVRVHQAHCAHCDEALGPAD